MPGGVISEHIHPFQEERFSIVAGAPRFIIAGKETTAKARETIVVPAGVRHCEGDPPLGRDRGRGRIPPHPFPRLQRGVLVAARATSAKAIADEMAEPSILSPES